MFLVRGLKGKKGQTAQLVAPRVNIAALPQSSYLVGEERGKGRAWVVSLLHGTHRGRKRV